jgi:hypothetical protein
MGMDDGSTEDKKDEQGMIDTNALTGKAENTIPTPIPSTNTMVDAHARVEADLQPDELPHDMVEEQADDDETEDDLPGHYELLPKDEALQLAKNMQKLGKIKVDQYRLVGGDKLLESVCVHDSKE